MHRLVAAAFLGERPSGRIVHHKDHVKRNNRPENLEYVTPSVNIKLAYADGQIGKTLKLNAFARKKIVELYETGEYGSAELAAHFGISRSSVFSYLKRAGIKPFWMRKLTPAKYREIREKWIPFKYPVRKLAEEYQVSKGLIEWILGMRKNRGKVCLIGKDLPQ